MDHETALWNATLSYAWRTFDRMVEDGQVPEWVGPVKGDESVDGQDSIGQ